MKKFSTFVLTMIMAMTCCLCAASAASDANPKASVTLSTYGASCLAGSYKNEISISFNVTATNKADQLGATSIAIYKSDGTHVTTITGSTDNGMLRNSAGTHRMTYTYTGTSGVTYYAKVTVYAKIGGSSDSRTITTSTAKAP